MVPFSIKIRSGQLGALTTAKLTYCNDTILFGPSDFGCIQGATGANHQAHQLPI